MSSAAVQDVGARAAPKVVVVVLNWCGESDTDACLRTVVDSDYPHLVPLLVDNGSPDGSGARLAERWPHVPYLQTGANLGYTGGNNRGFAWARAQSCDYVLVLNNDTELDARCVSQLVQTAESDPAIGAVAPKILVHDEPQRIWFGGGRLDLPRGGGAHKREGALDTRNKSASEPTTFLTGCCFLISRRALDAVDGFEESFFAYNEDVDLSWRLARAGFRLVYEPRARLTHKVPTARTEPTPFQITMRDRNRRRFVRLRLNAVQRATFAAWFYPTRAVHVARYALRGDWARVRAVWEGMQR